MEIKRIEFLKIEDGSQGNYNCKFFVDDGLIGDVDFYDYQVMINVILEFLHLPHPPGFPTFKTKFVKIN